MRIEEVTIDRPCDADWEGMRGGEDRRFCEKCSKNVYHLSAMTRRQVETLLESRAEGLCVRYSQSPAEEVRLVPLIVEASAPGRQARGAQRLVASAMALVAGTFLASSIALAQPSQPPTIAGGIRPVHDPRGGKPPVVPPQTPQVEVPGEGSAEAEGSAAPEEAWMGETVPEPKGMGKTADASGEYGRADVNEIYAQERAMARVLQRFGLTLEEVEIRCMGGGSPEAD